MLIPPRILVGACREQVCCEITLCSDSHMLAKFSMQGSTVMVGSWTAADRRVHSNINIYLIAQFDREVDALVSAA